MSNDVNVIAGVGLDQRTRKSHWPARLDFVQSASGLFLGLFMWGHMAFVSTILISNDAMWWVTKMFEGQFILGKAYSGIVAAVVALVSFMFVLHGLLAMRKFPGNFQEYKSFASHRKMLRHEDTTLWWVQAWTGFALFFLASVHLYQMLMHPGRHRPLRVGGARVERPLVAAVSGPVVCRRAARRRRSLPVGGQVGLVRRERSESDTHDAQAAQVGNHDVFPDARTAHTGGLHEARPRAPRSGRRALCAVLGRAIRRGSAAREMGGAAMKLSGVRFRVSGLKPNTET